MMDAAQSGLSLLEIAARLADILPVEVAGDATCRVVQAGALESAEPGQITFLSNPKYRPYLKTTRASAVILTPAMAAELPQGMAALLTPNPYLCYAHVVAILSPPARKPPGIHPAATVDEGAVISSSCHVGAGAWIGAGATLGERVEIHANAMIGEKVEIGADSVIYPGVSIYPGCRIGARAIIHSGVVIGSDGFGFVPEGGEGGWVKILQKGAVVIGNDVEIGANTCIDRGAIDDTVIGDGVKMDNQIHIAHNCVIGEHCALAGCVGLAGSAKLGHHVMLGGSAMIHGHISIVPHAEISPGSLVTNNIKEPGKYTGIYPLDRHEAWLKNAVFLRRLEQMAKRLSALERALNEQGHQGN
ncbi:MAG: UDP-3-O-(3-hydroxymyristoyl)glucosamine N-acyltransferase [Betaproteobacteria bacterium]|nr:UDP-3-O-(3-hydroxymyristoyl)glucosamine N-acyltransferase [Betaproteobacteria bacterium]